MRALVIRYHLIDFVNFSAHLSVRLCRPRRHLSLKQLLSQPFKRRIIRWATSEHAGVLDSLVSKAALPSTSRNAPNGFSRRNDITYILESMILQYVISFGAMVRQHLCNIVISILRRNVKCGPALVVLCIYVRTMLNKQACDLEAPTLYCANQWRVK